MINIIIVEDHKLFSNTLRLALSECSEFNISGEAENGKVFFSLLKAKPCDIVLLDIEMPDMSGVEIAKLLRTQYPDVKILIISCVNSTETVRTLLEIGVEGFISKQSGNTEKIINAVKNIVDGYEYYGEDIAKIIYRMFIFKKQNNEKIPALTSREKEIIELCRKGLIVKEIANYLNISINTVNIHKTHIFKKLNINNTMEMVQYAIKNGIIRME